MNAAGDGSLATAPALVLSGGERDGVTIYGPGEQIGASLSFPLLFMGNAGQFPDNVIFMAISDSGPISFGAWGSDLSLVSPESGQTALVGFRFDGASDAVTLAGMERLDCSANFLTGNDPEAWITGVEMYRGIKYVGLYPGIDLVYEGLPDGLKSTYIVRPGADPGVIILEYSGQEGLSLAPDGSLVLTTRAGPVVHSAPYCYQLIEGSIVEVSSSYRMTGQGGVGFMVGDYDPGYDLVIDPVLKYGLYLRGLGVSEAYGVASDPQGNAYVTGRTFSTPYNVSAGSTGSNAGGTDVVVVKINPEGTLPLFITYLGGEGNDAGYGIQIDASGGVYVVGTTNSTNFPVVNPLQGDNAGLNDAFVMRLAPNGSSLVYSTYLGGNNNDYGYAIALDGANNAYITGSTESSSFSVPSTMKRTSRGGISDAYLLKIRSDGRELIDTEYVGGKVMETGYGIAVDEAGYAYIAGETFSWDFPVKNAAYPTFGGYSDAFVTKIAPAGDPFVYSTYIGGSDMDGARAIDVGSDGSVHVTGLTRSRNFPTKNAFKPVNPGLISSFYTRLEPSGNALNLSTYLTGPGFDEGRGIVVNPAGSVYITGITKAENMQTINASQPHYGGGVSDAFIAKFAEGESYPAYLTYFGGSNKEEAYGIAADGKCGVFISGVTWSDNMPASDPYPPAFTPAGRGGFVALVWDEETCCIPPIAVFEANPSSGYAPLDVKFTDLSSGTPESWSWEFGDGGTSTEQNPLHTYTTVGNYTVNLTVQNNCGTNTTSGTIVALCLEPVADFSANRTSGKVPLSVQFTDSSQNNVTSWSWQFGDGGTSTKQNPVHTYTAPGTYTVNLTVMNNCGSGTASKPMYITAEPCPLPVADFSANRTSGKVPLSVQFTDSSQNNVTSWSWQFGDGTTSIEQNPVHTYTVAGDYTVTLTVTNECGSDSASKQEYITAEPCPPPVANFNANRTSGKAPLSVQFTDLSTNDPDTWLWQFGDGDTSTEQNPVHTYTIPGTYTVNLTVTNECGSDSASKQEYITAEPCPPPVANFNANRTSGKAPLSVQFTDLSTNDPDTWLWQFGDGDTSTEQNPVHTYTIPGTYTVNLTVTNECGCDSASKQEYITAEPCPPPVADFSANRTSGKAPL
ncbi:MAG TPA: PKD domain-containing protein, partial [Methanoregulaceae archaeon]|nr:PKD domain-containing protein [Methanoregulaceae archaeon]